MNHFLSYEDDTEEWEVQEPFQALRKLARAFEEIEEGEEKEDFDFRTDCLLCQCLVYHILRDFLNARRTLKLVIEQGQADELVTSALDRIINGRVEIMFKEKEGGDSLDVSKWSSKGSSQQSENKCIQ